MTAEQPQSHQERCIKCMGLKGTQSVCPLCGYDESRFKQEAIYLRPRTVLFSQYLCGLPLGKGGFGITYIGWDLALERTVAIKEFFPSALATRQQSQFTVMPNSSEEKEYLRIGLRMFLAEARRVAQFHEVDGIVAVHNFFEDNDTAYMVMEYLTGSDLFAYLQKRGGRLGLDEALDLLRPVLSALKRIHAAKVFHRDISAQNIIITDQDKPKLIDFGAAKYTVREKSDTVRVVKAGYSPLEQYSSRGRIGPWTDIYAVGATLYLMLSGKLPPESPDRLYQDEFEPLSELVPEVPEHIDQAVLHCLAVKSIDRYQSIEELEAALYGGEPPKAAAGEGAGAPPPPSESTTVVEPSSGREAPSETAVVKPKSKLPWILAAVIGALILGLAILFLAGGDEQPAPPAKAPLPAETMTASDYEQAQKDLAALDLYTGEAHGRWDQASQAAARKFQKQHSLEPTGKLDKKLARLLTKAAAKAQEAENRRNQVESALQKAAEHLAAGRLDQAEQEYQEALRLDESSQKAKQGLQKIAQARREKEQNQRFEALLNSGRQSLEQGQPEQAREAFQQALIIKPDSAEAKQGLEKAQRAIEQAGAQDQEEQQYQQMLREGRQSLEQGQYEQARERFQRALELRPDSAVARRGLEEAQNAIQRAQAQREEEQNYQEFLRKGQKSLEQGQYEQARENFQRALELRPDSIPAKQGLEQARQQGESPPTTEAAPAAAHGSLVIHCQPKAKVFLDGREVGATPLTLEQVAAGAHKVVVKGMGGEASQSVEISQGSAKKLSLAIKGGEISVNASPWAEVFLDGQNVGYTPKLLKNLVLGPHTITVRRKGFKEQSRKLELRKGKPAQVTFRLKKQ